MCSRQAEWARRAVGAITNGRSRKGANSLAVVSTDLNNPYRIAWWRTQSLLTADAGHPNSLAIAEHRDAKRRSYQNEALLHARIARTIRANCSPSLSFSTKTETFMKILVAYKRVVDYNVRVQVKPDGSGVMTDGVKLSANPFDDIALEEALRLREKGIATEVIVVSIAPADAQAHLRNGLAMGANRAIHVVSEQAVPPLTAARVLLKLIETEQPGLVLLGKQAIDDDASQTGQMLAALWDRPQATFASKVEVSGTTARVTREIDAGLEVLEVDLPAVITVDLRLNEPRFIKLPDIMKAKSKPFQTIAIDTLAIDVSNHHTTTRFAPPAQRQKGVLVKDVPELVAVLKARGLL